MFRYHPDQVSRRQPRRRAAAAIVAVACTGMLLPATASASPLDGAAEARSRAGALPILRGTVGPGFTISFSEDSIPAGKYKVIVQDKGTIHNFHIFGRKVNEKTSVPGTGKQVWKIVFREGDYTIQCDPHSDVMNTTLEVTV